MSNAPRNPGERPWRPDNRGAAIAVVTLVIALTVVGTVAAGPNWQAWWESLDRPAWLIPIDTFLLASSIFSLLLAVILYRVLTRTEGTELFVLAGMLLLLLVANEIWNWAFLGQQSVEGGFIGMVLLAGLALGVAASMWNAGRRVETGLFVPYLVWILYALVGAFALWQRNG